VDWKDYVFMLYLGYMVWTFDAATTNRTPQQQLEGDSSIKLYTLKIGSVKMTPKLDPVEL